MLWLSFFLTLWPFPYRGLLNSLSPIDKSSFVNNFLLLMIPRYNWFNLSRCCFCIPLMSQCQNSFPLNIWRQPIAPWLQMALCNFSWYFRSDTCLISDYSAIAEHIISLSLNFISRCFIQFHSSVIVLILHSIQDCAVPRDSTSWDWLTNDTTT